MPLGPGTRLGNFEIIGALGAGGMGEVYRARDTKLRRDIALKVLPPQFAADRERLERFQREATAVAALNHPNVVTIYSIEDVGGIQFLTMELIEGRTLVDLIPPGGLALEPLLAIALPLVDAISAAHQRGIVHRDLKPANVMVGADGRLKVLDFGLAKLRPESADARDHSVLTTDQLTAAHDVFGTPAYMSPEQAEGKLVDVRSDVFSLGVLIYEMATGTRPFRGDSALGTLSSILKDEPSPVAQVRPDLPADITRITRRCLAKDPARRYQTATDIRNELLDVQHVSANAVAVPSAVPSGRRFGSGWATGLVVAAMTIGVAWSVFVWRRVSRGPASAPVGAAFERVTSQQGAEFFPSLSPDGKWIVYSGDASGNRDIYLQSIGGQTAINLTADSAEDDEEPAFSPDGEHIAFRSGRDGGGIFIMGRTGEAVRRVTREGFNPAWSPDGTRLAYTRRRTELRPQNAEERSALLIVDATGGEPRVLRANDAMLPSWSPSGVRIAFSGRFETGQVQGRTNIYTVTSSGGDPVPVTNDGFLNWNPVWAPEGERLYFVSNRGGAPNIWRVALDEQSGQTRGEAEPVTSPASFATHLSFSRDGRHMAYSAVLESQNIQKLRLNPGTGETIGEPIAVTTGSRFWSSPDPSPDGEQVVFYSAYQPEGDLYIAKSDGSSAPRQLTSDPSLDRVPRWSPDGQWIAMFSDRTGQLEVWKIHPDGSGLAQVTHGGGGVATWSPKGNQLAVTRAAPGPNRWVNPIIDVDGPGDSQHPQTLAPLPQAFPGFAVNSWSVDGEKIAGQNGYASLGISIYAVRQRTYQRLTEFGEWPVWFPDSRRVLFVSRGREFHVLDTATKATKKIFSVARDTLGPPRLTRAGREAFFSRRITEADVWLATLR
jgi:Tol biopolymer transport system component